MELIDRLMGEYQVRKTAKQKTKFREFAASCAAEYGWEFSCERASLGAVNVVLGDPDGADVIFTAHYDTAPVLPFPNFITPKSLLLYILYSLGIAVAALAVCFGASMLLYKATESLWAIEAAPAMMLAFCVLMIAGPANCHTANDNTSGVAVALEIAARLPQELKGHCAIVLFDLEEAGLIGSASFSRAHRGGAADKLIINFDCVSDGDRLLLAARKGARPYDRALEQAFGQTMNCEKAYRGVIYPSDQLNFPAGVGVAVLKKARSGIVYLDRLHTPRDTVMKKENIYALSGCSVKLVQLLCEKGHGCTDGRTM